VKFLNIPPEDIFERLNHGDMHFSSEHGRFFFRHLLCYIHREKSL